MKSSFLAERDTTPTAPNFFYSLVKDTCDYNGISFPATNNSANGDLCAYIPGTNPVLLYACPAPDAVCWSFAKTCAGSNSTDPGPLQISCDNNSDTRWCCNAEYEECTQTAGQINVCWAKTFQNPNDGLAASAAASIASSAVSASQASALSSRISAISATSATTTVSARTTTSSRKATGTASPLKNGGVSKHRLSGGAIAGIIIGSIAAAIIFALLVLFFLQRRKRRNFVPAPRPGALESGGEQLEHNHYAAAQEKKLAPPQAPLSELPGDGITNELPGDQR
jgi:hypothetical protein